MAVDTKNQELQTMTAGGRPAEKRIASSQAAKAIYKDLKAKNASSALARAHVRGLYHGNPPQSLSEQTRRGRGAFSNIDWGEFRNGINLQASSIWNMFNTVDNLVTLSSDLMPKSAPKTDWGIPVAQAYTRILRAWDSYQYNMMFRILECLLEGNGVMYWMDEFTWRSTGLRASNLFVDPKAKCDINELEFVQIRDEVPVRRIVDALRDEDAAKKLGWNVREARNCLVQRYTHGQHMTSDRYTISDWESLQQAVGNKDYAQRFDMDGFRIVHTLTKDLTAEAGITHQIFWEDDDQENRPFIFEAEGRFDEMSQVLSFLVYNIGDGYIKSIRGLARELFHIAHASNRLLNTMVNGVQIGSGLLVQAATASAAESFKLLRRDPVTVIGPEVQVMQRQMMPSLEPAVQARFVLQQVQENNTGQYRARRESPQVERTATEAQLEAAHEARFDADRAEWLYSQIEKWHQETFRRLMNPNYPQSAVGYKDHRRFLEMLDNAGVPKELQNAEAWTLRATRALGLGSPTQRVMITKEMFSVRGSRSDPERHNIDREFFAARVGYDKVDLFVKPPHEARTFEIQHAMAEGESVDMMNGNARRVPTDDFHQIHWEVHMAIVTDTVEKLLVAMQQGGGISPVRVMGLELHVSHLAGHLSRLQQEPTMKNVAAEFEDDLKKLVAMIEPIKRALAQQQQQAEKTAQQQQQLVAQAQQKEIERTVEIEKYKADRQKEVELYKADQLHEARMRKADTSTQAKLTDLGARLNALEAETIAKIAREDRKAAAETRRTAARPATKEGSR